MRVVLCQGVKTRWLVRQALDGGLDVGRIIETVLRHAGLLEDGERIADAALALTVEHQYLDIAGPCLFQDEQRFFEGQGFSLLDNEGAMRGKDRGGIEGVTRGNIACQRLALCQQASRAIVAGQDGDLTPCSLAMSTASSMRSMVWAMPPRPDRIASGALSWANTE